MPLYVVNAGKGEDEYVVHAKRYRDSEELIWFYNSKDVPFMCFKKEFVETLDEQ